MWTNGGFLFTIAVCFVALCCTVHGVLVTYFMRKYPLDECEEGEPECNE